jgi:uncharacterized damage-inducible protein DinB
MRVKWTDREFNFDFPAGIYPEMIERVSGTPARLEDRLRSVSSELLTRRENERWSMQENAGHLLDLESLFSQRLDEYIAGAKELHAADMSNRKTYEADHNSVPLELILESFREQREYLSNRLDELDERLFSRRALHPRLNVSMRLVDMLYFQSEHDDYHLARISELIRTFSR